MAPEGQLARHAHGNQHVGGLDRAGGAGGPAGRGDAGKIEVHQQGFAVGTVHRDAEKMRRAGARLGVDHQVRHRGLEPGGQLVAQRAQTIGQRALLTGGELSRPSQAHGAGHVLGARPDTELLSAAMDDGLDRLAVAHDESTDSLGRSDLVSREGEQGAGQLRSPRPAPCRVPAPHRCER